MATQAAALQNPQMVAFPAEALHSFSRGNAFVTLSESASEKAKQEFRVAVAALKELGIHHTVRGWQVTISLRAQS